MSMWTSREHAEFVRLKNAFGRALYDLSWSEGVTERGEPWLVALDLEDETLVLHIARLDGHYVALDGELDEIAAGAELTTVVDACISRMGQRARADTGTVIRLRPAHGRLAIFAALIADMLRERAEARTRPDDGEAAPGTAKDENAAMAAARRGDERSANAAEPAGTDRDLHGARQSGAPRPVDTRLPAAEAPALGTISTLLIAGAIDLLLLPPGSALAGPPDAGDASDAAADARTVDGEADAQAPTARDGARPDGPGRGAGDLGKMADAFFFAALHESGDTDAAGRAVIEADDVVDISASLASTLAMRAAPPKMGKDQDAPAAMGAGAVPPASAETDTGETDTGETAMADDRRVSPVERLVDIVGGVLDRTSARLRDDTSDTILFREREVADEIRQALRDRIEPIVSDILEARRAEREDPAEIGPAETAAPEIAAQARPAEGLDFGLGGVLGRGLRDGRPDALLDGGRTFGDPAAARARDGSAPDELTRGELALEDPARDPDADDDAVGDLVGDFVGERIGQRIGEPAAPVVEAIEPPGETPFAAPRDEPAPLGQLWELDA